MGLVESLRRFGSSTAETNESTSCHRRVGHSMRENVQHRLFPAELDAALGEQLFYVANAGLKAEIKQRRMADNLERDATALK